MEAKRLQELFDAKELGMAPSTVKEIVTELLNGNETPQNNPNHVGSLVEHTSRVVNAVLESGSIPMIIAAVFHDVGKSEVKKVNAKTGYDSFINHASASVDIVADRKAEFTAQGISEEDFDYALEIIKLHDTIYSKAAKVKTMLEEHPNGFAKDILSFHMADIAGQNGYDVTKSNPKNDRRSKLAELKTFAQLILDTGTPEQTVGVDEVIKAIDKECAVLDKVEAMVKNGEPLYIQKKTAKAPKKKDAVRITTPEDIPEFLKDAIWAVDGYVYTINGKKIATVEFDEKLAEQAQVTEKQKIFQTVFQYENTEANGVTKGIGVAAPGFVFGYEKSPNTKSGINVWPIGDESRLIEKDGVFYERPTPTRAGQIESETPEWLSGAPITKNEDGSFTIKTNWGQSTGSIGSAYWVKYGEYSDGSIDANILTKNEKSFAEYNVCTPEGENICSLTEYDQLYNEILTMQTKTFLARTASGKDVYLENATLEHMQAHPDVNMAHIVEAIGTMDAYTGPFSIGDIDLGRVIGKDKCVEIGDAQPQMLYRKNRNGQTPILVGGEPADTSRITVGICLDDDGRHTMFTSYYGQLAPREPWDPAFEREGMEAAKAEAEQFWSTHALIASEGDPSIDWERSGIAVGEAAEQSTDSITHGEE